MFTAKFRNDAIERALSTAAQTAVAVVGMDQISALQVDWKYVGGVALTAGILSLLKSVAARRTGDSDSASLVQ